MLSPLFDSVGRVTMISGTYLLSGVLLAIAGLVLGDLSAVTLMISGPLLFGALIENAGHRGAVDGGGPVLR